MKPIWPVAIAAGGLAFGPGAQALSAPGDTVVFEDDFHTGGTAGTPDPAKWVVNVPESWWWTQGDTFRPSPEYHPDGPFPKVSDGTCTLEHHTYNPYDLAPTHWTFLGGQIRTVRQFAPSGAYRLEATVRGAAIPKRSRHLGVRLWLRRHKRRRDRF